VHTRSDATGALVEQVHTMTLRQFLDFTKHVPAADVTRAVNTILAS
jgi:hypothetical protein